MPNSRLPKWGNDEHPADCICFSCRKHQERKQIWLDAIRDYERAEDVITEIERYYPLNNMRFYPGDVLLQGRGYLHPKLR